jgi:hypothetical protein
MTNPKDNRSTIMMNLPQGWVLISDDFLHEFEAEDLPHDEAIAFFDGLSPTWKEALSDRIPRRGPCSKSNPAQKVRPATLHFIYSEIE